MKRIFYNNLSTIILDDSRWLAKTKEKLQGESMMIQNLGKSYFLRYFGSITRNNVQEHDFISINTVFNSVFSIFIQIFNFLLYFR